MKIVAIFASLMFLVLAVGLASANTTWSGQLRAVFEQTDGRVVSVYGLEKRLTLEELAEKADLIVVGVATSDQVRSFRENAEIPEADRDPRLYAEGAYHDMSFRVLEYVKGSGPSEISVRWLASSPGLQIRSQTVPELQALKQYVLFLNTGTGAWTGGYTMLGRRGAGDLVGQEATFAEYGTLSLDRIRQAARSGS